MRAKRLCRVGPSGDSDIPLENDMMIDAEQSILEAQTSSAVEDLKSAIAVQYVNPYSYMYMYLYVLYKIKLDGILFDMSSIMLISTITKAFLSLVELCQYPCVT